MKFLSLLFFCLLLSCNSMKTHEKVDQETDLLTEKMEMDCPEKGTCAFSVLKNKSLNVLVDGTGMNYPQFEKNAETDVIKFSYHREAENGMTDGDYTEVVYFEVNKNLNKTNLEGKALQKVKLLYGRLCFCKGSAGYFKVTKGSLKFERNKDGSADFALVFGNQQVPQLVKEIKGTVVLVP